MSHYIFYVICIVTYITNINMENADVLGDFEEDTTIFVEDQNTAATKMSFRNDKNPWIAPFSTRPVASLDHVIKTKRISLKSNSEDNVYSGCFNDPYWKYQWFAHDQRRVPGPVMDHNLVPVYWRGHTGAGVVVGVIGDGVKHEIEDLKNVKEPEDDFVPIMRQADPNTNAEGEMYAEGTKMAGVIAMNANNSLCGVGVAFNADIVGIGIKRKQAMPFEYRLVEAITYGKYKRKEIDEVLCHIYAFATGRPDDGSFMKINKDIENAFKKGVTKGRGGKGSIYVVGAGNGKETGQDNCAADDLANDPNAVVVASADRMGRVTPYSERCAAVMATAYSSGVRGPDDEAIVTTDVGGSCTKYYTGNHPSVGIAAGIFALVLQANPQLTERDLKHLILMTSEVAPLLRNPGSWTKNKAGFYVSNDFGFGLLNAENMVIAASSWTGVPPKETTDAMFIFDTLILEPGKLSNGYITITPLIQYIEQIELISNLNLEYRGSLMMNLTSPSETNVVMLEQRPRDRSGSGLKNWRIKTAHFWGENPAGTWTVTASIAQFPKQLSAPNEIKTIKLVIHGTTLKPDHQSDHARTYSAFYIDQLNSTK